MKYYRNKKIEQDTIEGDIILYNEDKEVIVTLNETASIIWQELEGKTFEDVRNSFMLHYNNLSELEKDLAKNDLIEVLEKLVDTGCVICVED